VAFYYSSNLPAAALAHFDRVIVQADQADAAGIALLRRRGTTVYAYVSLSEVSRAQAHSIDPRLWLGDNADWNTVILDAAQPEWRKQLLEKSFAPLWERGFHAFFLDNLDSYQRAVQGKEKRAEQVKGLSQIIKELHARFPGVELLLNRGFE